MANAWLPVVIPEQPDTFWAYLAAFIDGEGSVSMCQNGPRLIICNTDLKALEGIKASLGGQGYIQELQRKGRLSKKPCYNLTFGARAIRLILPKVIPFMLIKRKRSEILMEYLDTVVPRGGNNYHQDFEQARADVKRRMLEATN